jgi:hypothetical protein
MEEIFLDEIECYQRLAFTSRFSSERCEISVPFVLERAFTNKIFYPYVAPPPPSPIIQYVLPGAKGLRTSI